MAASSPVTSTSRNPHALEVEDQRQPLEIVEAITAREREIIAIMDDIRAELAEGL